MGKTLSALAAGLLFGAGLALSGMVNPDKVLNFLDFAGSWDPSLAFVMAGGLAVTFVGYRLGLRRAAPLFAPSFQIPTKTDIDARLLAGAGLFGLGWGLVGLCPGPALSGLLFGQWQSVVFVAAMVAGMLGTRMMERIGRSAHA